MSYVKGLKCRECGCTYAKALIAGCEECFGPLEVEYDYDGISREVSRQVIESREKTLWRYRELLPLDGVKAPHEFLLDRWSLGHFALDRQELIHGLVRVVALPQDVCMSVLVSGRPRDHRMLPRDLRQLLPGIEVAGNVNTGVRVDLTESRGVRRRHRGHSPRRDP